jgi:hypothetical protein
VLLDEDVAEGAVLAEQDGLERTSSSSARNMATRARSERVWLSRRRRATGLSSMVRRRAEELDHLADGDRVLLDVDDRAVAGAFENVAEDAHQVDGVGGDLRLGGRSSSWNSRKPGLVQVAASSICFCCSIWAAFLKRSCSSRRSTSSRRGSSAASSGPAGARQQHLALDVDEQRGGVDELAGHIHVGGLELVDVGQELRRDLGDGNVVDVDVLLADQVQQQVEGPS